MRSSRDRVLVGLEGLLLGQESHGDHSMVGAWGTIDVVPHFISGARDKITAEELGYGRLSQRDPGLSETPIRCR